MNSAHDIIKALIHTEKTTLCEPQGKYLFLVENSANKIQIRRAVEDIYKVKVKDVNTFVSLGKLKRVRHQLGRTSDLKKAVVTLRQGQKIEVA
ncbi:MAG: 50S ribosomal protein L23 [Candidatus Omnitrophota bacterium]